jgi:hypothetical protein
MWGFEAGEARGEISRKVDLRGTIGGKGDIGRPCRSELKRLDW